MFDNQYNFTPNGGMDPQNLCPCTSNGCTHACTASGDFCYLGCGNGCSNTCLNNCSYSVVFTII